MKIGTVLLTVVVGSVALACTVWIGRYRTPAPPEELKGIFKTRQEVDARMPELAPEGPYPKVVVEEDGHYSFGVMAVGEERQHTFVIRNEGEAELILREGATSCECTVSDFAGDKKTVSSAEAGEYQEVRLAPGESAKVTLTWRTEWTDPEFQHGATILTNDPESKVIGLGVTGEVTELIALEPDGTWDVGELRENQPTVVRAVMHSRIAEQFQVTDIESTHGLMTAKAVPLSEPELSASEWKSGYEIVVTISPGVTVGRFREKLVIHAEANGETRDFTVSIKGFRTGPFRILPTAGVTWRPDAALLELGEFDASVGKTVSLLLFVHGLNEEFELLGFESDVSELVVRLEPDEEPAGPDRQRYRLVLEIPPGTTPTASITPPFAKASIQTNHPDAQQVTFFLKFLSR